MAAITPNSDLYLLKCPLEIDNNHQLSFASKTAQANYFLGLPKKLNIEDDSYSYIRHDSVIRVDAHIDTLLEYNYVMYRNDAYSNKWFYAFIIGMEYLNDGCTAVRIKTDVWQTWQFDLTFRKCFVEREHVNDDTIGINTVPENFELGEFICNYNDSRPYADVGSATSHSVMVAFQVTRRDLGQGNVIPINEKPVYGGLAQGCFIFGIPYDDDHIGLIQTVVSTFDAMGFGDAIVSIFLVPHDANPWTQKAGQGIFNSNDYYVPSTAWREWGSATETTITRPLYFEDYIPRNNKLYTAPYSYFHISNHLGSDVSYAYEDFRGDPKFSLIGTFSPSCSVKFIPTNSKKGRADMDYNSYDEGINGGVLPTLSWLSDYYLNWQAVNAKNIEIQTALSGANFAFDFLGNIVGSLNGMGTPSKKAALKSPLTPEDTAGYSNVANQAGGLVGFASDIANTMQAVRQAKMTPPQAKGNTSTGDLAFSSNRYCFEWYCMSIKAEYARKIDNYWSAYGYKVNEYKVPNLQGRANWNYVQTKDVNILADIPQGDLAEIKSFFDRGITIWHNPTTFLDYTQDNNIV